MFALEVALLTGRYVATEFNDRSAVEWPPHPARLFSALVATHFEALDPPEHERSALQWLERQGPPEISADDAGPGRDVVTVFVPVNDASVVGSLDAEIRAVDEARSETEAARKKGGRSLATVERKLAKAEEAVRKALAPVPAGKEGKEGPKIAASLLPDWRGRQPRTFPSVAPAPLGASDPRLVFAWPAAQPSENDRLALDGLAERVVRLGHSSSLVAVRVRADRPAPTWIPDESGGQPQAPEDKMLRVVAPGQLEALCAGYVRQADAPGRVLPATFTRYVRPRPPAAMAPPSSVFGDDWVVLRRIDGPRLPSVFAAQVGGTVRKALMAAHGAGVPEMLSGHRASGERSERPHLAYVPLPFVGRTHADGSILGVALVLPRAATSTERALVYRALATWEERAREERDDDRRRLPVHLGRGGVLGLTWLEEEALQSTLRAATWCAEARQWASATPVALDRNPGDLRSSDARKEEEAYADAEASLELACERIGLPRPTLVTVVPAAPLAGADKARRFPPFAAGTPPLQRVLVHATLTFEAPVRGPILIGAGRYLGLGLFRPLRGDALGFAEAPASDQDTGSDHG